MSNRIDRTLNSLRQSGKQALVSWVTIGYPDVDTSESLAKVILESGADMLEMGVPFSDPLADGPTIQMTSYRALQNGVTVRACLDSLRRLRESGVESPLIFLGYYNPFMQYGIGRFLDDARIAGLDGIIVPDLPTEESTHLAEMASERGIHLIPLLAPTSTDARIEEACKAARGFIYCVSLTGVTGARSAQSDSTSGLVERTRRYTDLPVLVGFGVSSREHLEQISTFADGAIVASALLDAVDRAPEERRLDVARDFIHSLRGTDGGGN